MANFFEDAYTRATDITLASHVPTVLGDGYTLLIDVGGVTMTVQASTDTLVSGGSLSDGALYTADVTYPTADYEAIVTAVTVDTGDDKSILAVRIQDSSNMYAVQFNGTNTGTTTDRNIMYKKVANVWTAVGSAFAAVADGSVCKLQIVGTTLKFFDDGVEVASATVSDHSAAGKAGLGMGAVIVSGCDMSGQVLDNFQVNNLGSSETITMDKWYRQPVSVPDAKDQIVSYFREHKGLFIPRRTVFAMGVR